MSDYFQKESFYAKIRYKIRGLMKHSRIYLSHAPHNEKYGLCLEIWRAEIQLLALLVKCQKKYYNKTTLSELDICHEQIRELWALFYEMGYFGYSKHKKYEDPKEELRKFDAINVKIDELGKMIGSLTPNAKTPEAKEPDTKEPADKQIKEPSVKCEK